MITGRLGEAGLNEAEDAEVRVVIEKPIGYDLASARAQNEAVLEYFDESQVFRIDHYLGKETVQNLMALRFANALFEPVWNRNFIDHVQITAAEDIGVGTRAGYYEGAGALRDLVQNHMLQLLALLTMEPPTAFEANRLRDEKVKVLEAIAPPALDEVADMAVRAQYGAGRRLRLGVGRVSRGAGRLAGLPHRDLRGAAALREQLALGGRAVLPAHRQAHDAQADGDRGDPAPGSAHGLPGRGFGGREAQPDHPHAAAGRGRLRLAGRQGPRHEDADPAREHGVPLRDRRSSRSRRRRTSD